MTNESEDEEQTNVDEDEADEAGEEGDEEGEIETLVYDGEVFARAAAANVDELVEAGVFDKSVSDAIGKVWNAFMSHIAKMQKE